VGWRDGESWKRREKYVLNLFSIDIGIEKKGEKRKIKKKEEWKYVLNLFSIDIGIEKKGEKRKKKREREKEKEICIEFIFNRYRRERRRERKEE
jgi:hypothetical protein